MTVDPSPSLGFPQSPPQTPSPKGLWRLPQAHSPQARQDPVAHLPTVWLASCFMRLNCFFMAAAAPRPPAGLPLPALRCAASSLLAAPRPRRLALPTGTRHHFRPRPETRMAKQRNFYSRRALWYDATSWEGPRRPRCSIGCCGNGRGREPIVTAHRPAPAHRLAQAAQWEAPGGVPQGGGGSGGQVNLAPSMATAARDQLPAAGLDEADEAVRGTCEDASVCKR